MIAKASRNIRQWPLNRNLIHVRVCLVGTLTASSRSDYEFLNVQTSLLGSHRNGERGKWVYIREYNKPVTPIDFLALFFSLSLSFSFSLDWSFFSVRGLFISPPSVLEIAKENFDSHRCNDRLSITHFPQLCRAKHSFQRDISELYHFAVSRMDAFRGGSDISVR